MISKNFVLLSFILSLSITSLAGDFPGVSADDIKVGVQRLLESKQIPFEKGSVNVAIPNFAKSFVDEAHISYISTVNGLRLSNECEVKDDGELRIIISKCKTKVIPPSIEGTYRF